MKVGILTFHNAYNYGAILQAFATQEIVKGYGHEVEVINYLNSAICSDYESLKFHLDTLPKRGIKKIAEYIIEKYFYWRKRRSFKKFIKQRITLSKTTFYQGKLLDFSHYDVVLIGSDQLWNKDLTGGFDDAYWGEFYTKPEARIIAWSICMNNLTLNDEDKHYISNHLHNFNAISVRETSLQKFLKDLSGGEYHQTLDPTLMLRKDKWESLCHPVKEDNYILVYAVQDEDQTLDYAKKLAYALGKRIVIIRSYCRYNWTKENKEYAGPSEFLSYIQQADIVVTTSFHGTAFSLLFQKQFVCPIFRDNTRIESLLGVLELKSRQVHGVKDALSLEPINYTSVEQKIEMIKNGTELFLKSVLN